MFPLLQDHFNAVRGHSGLKYWKVDKPGKLLGEVQKVVVEFVKAKH